MGDQLDGDSDEEFEDQEDGALEDIEDQNGAQANEVNLDQSRLYIWNMVQGSVLRILLDAV